MTLRFAARHPLSTIAPRASGALRARSIEAALQGLYLDFANREYWLRGRRYTTPAAIPGWTYTRSGTAYDLAGTTRFSANVPRRTGAGLLVEAGATNLVLWSQDFSNAAWGKTASGVASAAVATQNAGIAPDGTLTATRLQLALNGGTNGADISRIDASFEILNATNYVASVWLRSNDGNSYVCGFDGTSLGAINNYTVTPTWQRFSFTATSAAVSTQIRLGIRGGQTPTNSNTADILAWGMQLELGTAPSSYIPTTTTSASRGADAASVTGLNSFLSSGAAVSILAGYRANALITTITQEIATLHDGGGTNRIYLRANNTAGTISTTADTAGVSQGFLEVAGAAVAGVSRRIAYRANTNDAGLSFNGAATVTDATYTIPASLSQLAIGMRDTAAAQLGGTIEFVAVMPRALTGTELQNAST